MKRIFIGLVALFIVVLGINSSSFKTIKTAFAPSITGTVAGEATEQKEITVILDFGEGKAETYSAKNAATVLEALEQTAKDNNIPLFLKEFSFGTLVETIGSKTNDKEKAWVYYVNGQTAEVGADQFEVNTGDIIEWKYEKIN
ncbi:MAG: hypothetical protein UU21_C0021G0019 [Candidatus Levybacteria bacterium GW2011_GWA2_40_8]|nr:MAG: hypothetical protein UU21_C0021G0019 [Candidatus Levybacteria bacterium GW2011_GWA2_40_8]